MTTDDGVEIYYRSVGQGPTLVCCNGVGVSTFFWKYIVAHFQHTHQLIVWDYRGHGRSDSPKQLGPSDVNIERCAQDLDCVLTEVGAESPTTLLGHSMGCQVILEYYKQHPTKCRALVPMFGTFGRPLDTFFNFKYSRNVFEAVRKLASLGGRSGRRLMRPLFANPLGVQLGHFAGLIDGDHAPEKDIELYMDHLNQLDQEVFFQMVSEMSRHDLTDLLPTVAVPVLVFAAEKDLFTPVHRARLMAESIPFSELIVLEGASHAAIVEHPDRINQRIERFFRERVNGPKDRQN